MNERACVNGWNSRSNLDNMIRLYDRELNSSFIRFYRLRSAAAAVASSTKASSTLPSTKLPLAVGQSVSLDMLFASPSTSASSPSIRAASSPLHQSAPTNPLDLLFLNAAAKSSPQQQPRQPLLLPYKVRLNPRSLLALQLQLQQFLRR